jgi:hypothetical protein
MVSLRKGIEKAGFLTPPSTSLRAVAKKFDLQSPILLLWLATLLKPETVQWDTGPVSSGEHNYVTANGHLWMNSTGSWKFTGEVTDNGSGASFAFAMTPKVADASGKTLIFGEANGLSKNESTSFSKHGRDMWIARNWGAIKANGYALKFQATVTTGVGEVLASVVTALLVALAIGGASSCNENDSWTTESNQDGSTSATCHAK